MSSNNLAISIKNLSKNYNVYKNPIDRIKQSFAGQNKKYFKEFLALDNISFDLKKGETLGIVGRNGSGKSTLLQILYGTLFKTSGDVKVNGRVSALLELGAGFNSEFTGYENINVVGSLYGLTKEELDSKLGEIIKFADIGDYIHQPVKTYSSGMFVRLAFSIVINVNPEILIIDEALAVGDIHFQSKCMSKLRCMIDEGITVVFVSHDIGTVKALCKYCLYLKDGKQVLYGKTAKVTEKYLTDLHLKINDSMSDQDSNKNLPISKKESSSFKNSTKILVSTKKNSNLKYSNRYGNGKASILDLKILNLDRTSVEELEIDKEFIIQISFLTNENLPNIAVGYSFRDLKGQMITGGVTTVNKSKSPKNIKKNEVWIVEAKFKNNLKSDIYNLSIGLELPIINNKEHQFLDIVENVLTFRSICSSSDDTIFYYFVKSEVDFHFFKK